ncbi:MAG: hypothetical protein ACI8R8_002535, partial [Paraglaciecola sp.]
WLFPRDITTSGYKTLSKVFFNQGLKLVYVFGCHKKITFDNEGIVR